MSEQFVFLESLLSSRLS